MPDLITMRDDLTGRAAKARLLGGQIGFNEWEQFYEVLSANESLPYLGRNIQVPECGPVEYRKMMDKWGEARTWTPKVEVNEYVWVRQDTTWGRQGVPTYDLPSWLTPYYVPPACLLTPPVFDRLPLLGPEGNPWREGRRGVVSYHLSVESANLALMLAWLAAGKPEYLRE